MGTGVGLVSDKDNEVHLVKSHLAAVDFLRTDMYDWVQDHLMESHVIMGHTRFPTFQDTVMGKYAQPYVFENTARDRKVMLTHNGHIQNYYELTKGIEGFIHRVDSGHIARAMAEAKEPKELLQNIKGAYALIWYDEVGRCVRLAKNDERDLYMAASKDKKKIYYCSEEAMLDFLLERAGIEHMGINNFTQMQCYTWNLDGEALYPGTAFKYKPKPVVVYADAVKNNGQYGGHGGKKGSTVWVHLNKTTSFMRYPAKVDGKENEYGRCYGGLYTDIKALVEIGGIREELYKGDLQLVRDSFPCVVSSCEMEDPPGGGERYPLYKVQINYAAFHAEVNRKKDSLAKIHAPTGSQMVAGPGQVMISREAWDKIAKENCVLCTKPIFGADIGKVGWRLMKTNLNGEDIYQMICPPCVHEISNNRRSVDKESVNVG